MSPECRAQHPAGMMPWGMHGCAEVAELEHQASSLRAAMIEAQDERDEARKAETFVRLLAEIDGADAAEILAHPTFWATDYAHALQKLSEVVEYQARAEQAEARLADTERSLNIEILAAKQAEARLAAVVERHRSQTYRNPSADADWCGECSCPAPCPTRQDAEGVCL